MKKMYIFINTVLLIFIVLVNFVKINASSNSELEAEKLAAAYTSNDYLDSTKTYTIRTYSQSYSSFQFQMDRISDVVRYKELYAGNIKVNSNNSYYDMAVADDGIINIIPKYYFENEGEFHYIGDEYGFYINTTYDSDLCRKGYNNYDPIVGGYRSNIIVFDIYYKEPTYMSGNSVELAIIPVMSAHYCCIPYNSWYLTIQNKNSRMENVVIPSCYFSKSTKYNISNVKFYSCVKNAFHNNVGDDDYNAKNDQGMYVIEQEVGFYDTPKAYLEKEKWTSDVAFACKATSVIAKFIPSPTVQVVGKIIGVIGPVTANLAETVTEKTHIEDDSYVTAINYSFSKDSQIKEYEELVKETLAVLTNNNNMEPAILETDNNEVASFKVSYYNHGDILPSNGQISIAFDIVDKYGNVVETLAHTYEKKYFYDEIINTNQLIGISNLKTTNFCTCGSDCDCNVKDIGLIVDVKNSGIYEFTCTQEVDNLLIYEINDDGVEELYDLNCLNEGKRYYLHFLFEITEIDSFNCQIQSASDISLDINGKTLLTYSFIARDSITYTFETVGCTDTYMYLEGIFDDLPYTDIKENDDGGEGTNAKIEANLIKGNVYTIKIRGCFNSTKGKSHLKIGYSGTFVEGTFTDCCAFSSGSYFDYVLKGTTKDAYVSIFTVSDLDTTIFLKTDSNKSYVFAYSDDTESINSDEDPDYDGSMILYLAAGDTVVIRVYSYDYGLATVKFYYN